MVKQLCGDDAQIFVDLVDEVSLYGLSPIEHKRINSLLNPRALSVRCWMILTRSSVGSVHVPCTSFVVAKPCFRSRLQSRFVITQRKAPCATADLRMCGRVDTITERLQPKC